MEKNKYQYSEFRLRGEFVKRLPYKTTLHALNEAKKSQVDYSENCPDITTMDLPLWVSHVRIESPQPLEYRLQFRSDAPCAITT